MSDQTVWKPDIPEQLLRYTGGWAGIVDVILRLESKYGAWNPESCWHEMNRYIKEIILDTLQRGRKGNPCTLRSTSRG